MNAMVEYQLLSDALRDRNIVRRDSHGKSAIDNLAEDVVCRSSEAHLFYSKAVVSYLESARRITHAQLLALLGFVKKAGLPTSEINHSLGRIYRRHSWSGHLVRAELLRYLAKSERVSLKEVKTDAIVRVRHPWHWWDALFSLDQKAAFECLPLYLKRLNGANNFLQRLSVVQKKLGNEFVPQMEWVLSRCGTKGSKKIRAWMEELAKHDDTTEPEQ